MMKSTKQLQKIQNKEHKINNLCSYSYFMTHNCYGCKRSRMCDELEEKHNDTKENQNKVRKKVKI
jgi:hypothetical protein